MTPAGTGTAFAGPTATMRPSRTISVAPSSRARPVPSQRRAWTKASTWPAAGVAAGARSAPAAFALAASASALAARSRIMDARLA